MIIIAVIIIIVFTFIVIIGYHMCPRRRDCIGYPSSLQRIRNEYPYVAHLHVGIGSRVCCLGIVSLS